MSLPYYPCFNLLIINVIYLYSLIICLAWFTAS